MPLGDFANYADNPQNDTNCLSLRNNAALLHSSATSALSAREQAVYVEALKLLENIVEAIVVYLRESAKSAGEYEFRVLYLICVNLRETMPFTLINYICGKIHLR